MLLCGSFRRALDDKLRVAIPSSWRETLGFPGVDRLYLAPGTDGSLALYPEVCLQAVARRLDQRSPAAPDARHFRRLFYSRIEGVEVDRQGRIRIPAELLSLTGAQGEIMLIGVGDHMELWSIDAWQRFTAQQTAHFDQFAADALAVAPTRATETT
jgi:MraZ protein